MANNPNLLLYIEPINPISKEPVIDELTRKMTASFRKSQRGALRNYDNCLDGSKFEAGFGWRGSHGCSCGAFSSCDDHLCPNGEVTNALCIHYLALHRDEISEEQLNRVRALDDGEEEPTMEEIYIPKPNVKFMGYH